jgi:hypothetical protein
VALSNERQFVSQRTFRSANERMQALVGDIVPAEQLIPFLCECADDACLGRVAMKRADYGDIHGDRDRYTILRDHQMADGEHVVEQRPLFDVVSKAAVV